MFREKFKITPQNMIGAIIIVLLGAFANAYFSSVFSSKSKTEQLIDGNNKSSIEINEQPVKVKTQFQETASSTNIKKKISQAVVSSGESIATRPIVPKTVGSLVSKQPSTPQTPTEHFQEGLKQYKNYNYSQAFSHFQKAANQVEANSLYYLGMMLFEGNGTPRDYSASFTCILKAAGQGHKDALFQLAQMYDRGIGISKDKKNASIWYQKAANIGNEAAQRRLDNM